MTQRLQELCALLVNDSCGQFCSQIFSTLAEYGRLSRVQLQIHTQIPGRQLRTALAVLIQHHLLHHTTTEEGLTFYQVDLANTYNLLRSDCIIALVEERYGESAAKIITILLQLGHATVADLAQAFDFGFSSKRDSGIEACSNNKNGGAQVNGADAAHHQMTQEHKVNTLSQFHKILRVLLKAGFLAKVGKRAYMPAADLNDSASEIVITEQFPDRKINGPKKRTEYLAAVNSLKRKWRDADDYSDHRDLQSQRTGRGSGLQPAKRAKINGVHTNGITCGKRDYDEDEVSKLPHDTVLKVNHARTILASRSQHLESLAEPQLGGATATVYRALLQVLEDKCRVSNANIRVEEREEDEVEDLPTANVTEIAEVLDAELDLTLGICGLSDDKHVNGDHKTKKKRKVLHPEYGEIGIKQEVDSDEEDSHQMNGYTSFQERNKRLTLIEEHLSLLQNHSKDFCEKVDGRHEWRVHFPNLTDTLIQTNIDSTVLSRFGRIHTRLLRLLRDRGRLEDKQIASLAVMRLKDVRCILTELQYAGFVEGQEIPRDAARQPTRSTYLYFHDQTRVQAVLLQHAYQAMSRSFQRLKRERVKAKSAIAKAELMDSLQEKLDQNETETLMLWRETEEKLLVQIQRMDEMVALLRDFSGKDVSLLS